LQFTYFFYSLLGKIVCSFQPKQENYMSLFEHNALREVGETAEPAAPVLVPFLPSPPYWKQVLRKNFVHWEKLSDFLELTPEQRTHIEPQPKFALNLPLRLAEKIRKGCLEDPILRQFLPTKEERINKLHFVADPVGDCAVRKKGKLLHKYSDRVLLLCTSACAMHCRYCFRQNFDYETGSNAFDQEIELIAADPALHEVILSGGDPLSLSNDALGRLLGKLAAIPHVKRIRFHSRFPIGIPERIDCAFLQLLNQSETQIWFVVHVNHPRELDEEVLSSLKRVQRQGVAVLNQSVLLKGVNDDFETLKELSQVLVNNGILPYYLHQLDPVFGSAHFEVEQEKGLSLIKELTTKLSGYAVPKYVKEIAGQPSKVEIKDENAPY
jgi:EF-P beta-lysylation protein EpmB